MDNQIYHIKEVVTEAAKTYGTRSPGLPTGIHKLDKYINGLEPSSFIILAARPGLGKTSFASTVGINASKYGKVLFLSLEMNNTRIVDRMLSSMAQVNIRAMVDNTLSRSDQLKVQAAQSELSKCNMYVDDSPFLTPQLLRKKLNDTPGVGLVIIDYLQLMVANRTEGRMQEVSDMSRELKLIAKEYNIPIVALAQLNRQCEYRDDAMPRASDLRESGSLEQDADLVLLLHRQSYYDIQASHTSEDDDGQAKIIIAKNRNGACEIIDCAFIGEYCGFYNLPQDEEIF